MSINAASQSAKKPQKRSRVSQPQPRSVQNARGRHQGKLASLHSDLLLGEWAGRGMDIAKRSQTMDKIVFQKKCPVCKCKDIEVEDCLGPKPLTGSRRRKAQTGECNECFAGFEIVSGEVVQIRDGRLS